ncbi:DUF1253-domain-containing protein [Serendipita vermifera]|nr:DUF1253-domain-containing protein [Serendipita vermifera]
MSSIETHQAVTTRLLTLLNVSALSTKKRKRDEELIVDAPLPSKKLNAKKVSVQVQPPAEDVSQTQNKEIMDVEVDDEAEDNEEDKVPNDPYDAHFGSKPSLLTEKNRVSVENKHWAVSEFKTRKYGELSVFTPEDSKQEKRDLEKLYVSIIVRYINSSDPNKALVDVRKELLSLLSSYQDLYLTKQDIRLRKPHREVVSLHLLNHIMKIRRRVLKNNEKLANSTKEASGDTNSPLDQGFVRPSILIVAPFRSSANHWVSAFLRQTPSHQIENKSRFYSEFSLPKGTEDKLVTAPSGTYPEDHVANMAGNIDDYFRIGLKVTRKSIKLFSDFYSSDIILASPLGLRELIEKEKQVPFITFSCRTINLPHRSADYLSSIEIMVIDQLDVLTMQNWTHLQLILSHLNTIPKESHDTDFSRIKPWYLDGHAKFLRQSILFTAYETPEIRSLFNGHLLNVAGKQRSESIWPPIQVPEGVKQNFIKFECNNAQTEIDKRFEYFTTQLFPSLVRSAVQSANTLIFIPSYFDYIRVKNWLKNQGTVSFTVLSEDSDNKDISRSRQAFFSGTKAMLLVTERFHFFRRYKLRGIRNLVFYAPPNRPQFYSEFLSFPFLDEDVQADDITCKILYSKYDYMRLERIVGTKEIGKLLAT